MTIAATGSVYLGSQRMVEQAYRVGMAVDIQPPYSTHGHMAYFVP